MKEQRGSTAFSLIEMIGVLAILAVLAAVMAPAVIKRLDYAARTRELTDLGAISNAFTLQILRSNSIPGASNWAGTVANWLNQPVSAITSNQRRFNRVLLIDPDFNLPGAGLPYVQVNNFGLTNRPSRARFIIASTLARGNPPFGSGMLSNPVFDETWDAAPQTKPNTWSNWVGSADEMCVQRINVEPLFYQLILVNRDTVGLARFSINNNATTTVVTNIWNQYYLDGSTLSLCNASGVVVSKYVVKQSMSFVFENGAWLGQILNGPPATNLMTGFAAAATAFFNTNWNSGTLAHGGKGAAQDVVLSAFANYMMNYTMWANMSPPFDTQGVNGGQLVQLPIWTLLQSDANNVDTYSGTGNWGLLNR